MDYCNNAFDLESRQPVVIDVNRELALATIKLPNFTLKSVDCSSNEGFIDWMTDELSERDAKDIYDEFNDALLEEADRMNRNYY